MNQRSRRDVSKRALSAPKADDGPSRAGKGRPASGRGGPRHERGRQPLGEQHLGVAANDREQVVEVVCHPAGELADGFHLLRMAESVGEFSPGILGSLAVCTVIFISLSLVLTGMSKYTELNNPAPVVR